MPKGSPSPTPWLCAFLCLLLAGCDKPAFQQPPEQADWQLAITTHSCTTEQMAKAQGEAEWCTKNTGYFSTYCYGSAILRNCEAKL